MPLCGSALKTTYLRCGQTRSKEVLWHSRISVLRWTLSLVTTVRFRSRLWLHRKPFRVAIALAASRLTPTASSLLTSRSCTKSGTLVSPHPLILKHAATITEKRNIFSHFLCLPDGLLRYALAQTSKQRLGQHSWPFFHNYRNRHKAVGSVVTASPQTRRPKADNYFR